MSRTKPLSLAGYEIPSHMHWQAAESNLGPRPIGADSLAQPVYRDEDGAHYVPINTDQGMAAVPFIPGSPATMGRSSGGFVSVGDIPPSSGGGGGGGLDDFMGGMLKSLPSQVAANWAGNAAQHLMLSGAPGGTMDMALAALGIGSPLSDGVRAALGSAASSAALGALQSLMPSGAAGSVANAVGGAGINALLNASGMSGIPGVNALAGMLGGGGLSNLLGSGGIANPLKNMADNIVAGGCTMPGTDAANDLDVNSITAGALNQATDYLASQWKVDDESSAAEHIANRAMNEYKGELQKILSDELGLTDGQGATGLMDRVKKFLKGVDPGSGLAAATITKKDDKGDACIMGVAQILVEGQPVSRMTDRVAGPMAPPPGKKIVIGEPGVLSADLPTAFLGSLTEVPSMMAEGAPTVLVGGPVAAAMKSMMEAAKKAKANAPPAAPKAPKKGGSGSASSQNGGANGEKKPDGTPSSTTGAPNSEGKSDSVNPEHKSSGETDPLIKAGHAAHGAGEGIETGIKKVEADDAKATAGEAKQAALDDAGQQVETAKDARGTADELKNKAADLDQHATGQQHAAQNSEEFKDSMSAREKATAAGEHATQAEMRATELEANAGKSMQGAESMPGSVEDIRLKPNTSHLGKMEKLGKGLKYAGMAGGVYETYAGVSTMQQQAELGNRKKVVETAGKTSGSLLVGFAGGELGAAAGVLAATTFGVATGGVGFVLIAAGGGIIGAVGGGLAGGYVGEAAGGALADYKGITNQSE